MGIRDWLVIAALAGIALGAPAAASAESFLRIPGVQGDSTQVSHEGWIVLAGFSEGASQLHQAPGRPAKTPSYQFDLLTAKPVQFFMSNGVAGKPFPAQVDMTNARGKVYISYRLGGCTVSQLANGANGQSNVTLTCEKAAVEQAPQGPG